MLKVGSVVQELFTKKLYRVGNTGAGCIALTLIEHDRLSGKSKIACFFRLFYKHRPDLFYSLLGGLMSNTENDNFPVVKAGSHL